MPSSSGGPPLQRDERARVEDEPSHAAWPASPASRFRYASSADPNHRGASRRWIIEGVEGSLRRLQTDWIDLYQVGVPDRNTDIDETLGALTDLVRTGKIRYFGASKVPASEIVEAQWVADRRGPDGSAPNSPPTPC
jgi:aryl-alcohol dehydrogenase-like predicted oxidoreductase